MNTLAQDIRQAVRALARAPGFTCIAVLTIALGIGANTAIYSLVHHVLFRPVPFLDTDRLVAVWQVGPGGNDHNEVSPADFLDLRAGARTLDRVVAHAGTNANLTGGDRPERVQGFAVSSGFFDALGMRPMLGRAFADAENTRGNDAVVLLTHALWTRRFGADSGIVGRSINVNGRARQVVGVLPRDVRYPAPAELYVPWAPTPEGLASRNAHFLLVTGRLAAGATVQQADAEIAAVARRLAAEHPATNARWGAMVRPFLADLTRMMRPVMAVLLGAVGFVLLVACANMVNLMLARGNARERELFVRAALGASPWRLARRVLVESAMLVAAGGILGAALGTVGLRALVALVPAAHARFLSGFDRIRVDGAVLLVTSAVVIVLSLLVSLLPAIRASRAAALESRMRAGGRGIAGRHRVRSTLVGVETAVAILLLVGAGLMVRTFAYLGERPTGVDTAHTALASITLPALRYTDASSRLAFHRDALAQVRALPGVTAAGATSILPMCQCNSTMSFGIDGAPPFPEGDAPDVGERVITPGYLESLAIGMRAGRAFADTDREDAPRVALVNEALARRWFPTGALGRRLLLDDTTRAEIVGVVSDVRHGGPASEPQPELYLPLAQRPRAELTYAVRTTTGDAASLLPAIRDVFGALDPELPLYDTRTMHEVAGMAIGAFRLSSWLLGALASLALVLAVIGIYGVASQLVSERTREIGIRMALGSAATRAVRFILRRGLAPVAIGGAAGLLAAAGLARALGSQLVGVPALDPVTYLGVSSLLFAAAVLAIYIPARRVARVDPMVVLRNEGEG